MSHINGLRCQSLIFLKQYVPLEGQNGINPFHVELLFNELSSVGIFQW